MLTPWVNIDHILAILPLDSRLKTHWHDGLKKPKQKTKKQKTRSRITDIRTGIHVYNSTCYFFYA